MYWFLFGFGEERRGEETGLLLQEEEEEGYSQNMEGNGKKQRLELYCTR